MQRSSSSVPQLQLTGSKNRTRPVYKSHSGACQGKHHWNSCIGFDKAAILTYSCSWPDGLTTIQLTLVCVSASAHDHGLHEVQEDHSEPSSTRRPCEEGTRLPTGPKTVRRVWLCPADSAGCPSRRLRRFRARLCRRRSYGTDTSRRLSRASG